MSDSIEGWCDEQFAPIADAFRANFADGLEIGASVGATWRGKTVVEMWGGWADPDRTRPWARDTVINVASTTKILLITGFMMLVDREKVELDAPVARYWPEFAQGGKAHVTVRQALSHGAGVPGFDQPVPFDLQFDWDAMTTRLAREPHWFEGEPRLVYHPFTYGWLLGELIRRVDGRPPAQYLQDEVAGPAGLDFLVFRETTTDPDRYAIPDVPLPGPRPQGDSLAARIMRSFEPGDRFRLRFTPQPAASGFSNGRDIARLCAIWAMNGELDGHRYLGPQWVAEASRLQSRGQCPLLGWMNQGLGFGLDRPEFPAPTPTAFHWGGIGGSMGIMDPACQLSLGYAPNNWKAATTNDDRIGDPRAARMFKAFRKVAAAL